MAHDAVNPDAGAPSCQEQYKMVRAQIEHENTLIGQRITWYLSFQGFLFTAATLALSLLDHGKHGPKVFPRGGVALACGLLGFLGILSSFVCYRLIGIANAHAETVKRWWLAREPSDARFPPIAGTGGRTGGKLHMTAAHFIFAVIGVWVYFIWLFFQGKSG